MKKITVKVNRYWLDTSIPAEADEYKKIETICKSKRYQLFDFTKYLFSDQYNTVQTDAHIGYRIHDWTEKICDNKKIKSGYYLSEEEDLQALIKNIYRCGWCGHQYTKEEAKKIKYCDKCRDDLNLGPERYSLLVLKPLKYSGKKIEKLPESVVIDILKQQKEAAKKQLEKSNKRKLEVLAQDIEDAKIEYEAFLWLIDNDIHIDNIIYYSHRDKFCFGWKTSYNEEEETKLRARLSNFPYKYYFNKE